jgi:transcriptional regulator with XRE-family HTH domain
MVYNMNLTNAVGGELKAELARRDLSQEVLMTAWKVNQSTVSAKLKGRSPISTEELDAAARALGFDPFEFVARAGANAVRNEAAA